MKNFTLGLDLGTNSIGWALLDYDEKGNPKSITECGSRIFQEAVDLKTRIPKNQSRRTARSSRRLVSRRKMRRINLLNLLINKNLLPENTEEQEKLFADKSFDPYQLRKKGLDEKLELYELGRALYHLCQRRGFQSNRKIKADDSNKISAGISTLEKEMAASSSRSLGEYLADQPKKRGYYTDRSMYQDEFELIWQAQQQYYPAILTTPIKVAVHNTIFFQRPLNLQKNLVGKCTFEPSRKRISRGLIEYQRFRFLQDINNLTVKNPITRDYRQLREDELGKLLELLEKQKTLSWGSARSKLGLHDGEFFNLEEGKKKELIGNRTACTLRSILKNQWDEMPSEKQNSLITDMLTIDNEQGFLNRMKSYWNFDDEIAEDIAKTELEPGYANLSFKAISKILPFLEKGLIYSEACLEAGYNHSNPNKQSIVDKLEEPPYLRNPVVQKSIFETRKLINAIVRKYGKPSVIRIEMARDMKLTKRQKQDIQIKQRQQQQENDIAREVLQEMGIQNPTREDVQKYNLWKECKELCPYTGTKILPQMLFSPSVDIEHIIPYSRSLDDSYMNKTLCMASENRAVKKNKTPFEAYNANLENYQEILQRVRVLPFPKRKKFEQKQVDTDKFVERQLNDTRYICREVKDYLQKLGVIVEVSKGTATSALRHQWNLNRILSNDNSDQKNRGDHRHHAIDAIVISLTSKSLFQKLSHLSKQSGRGLNERGFSLDEPWPSFYEDVDNKINGIIVSHAASRKITGALHEDTAYGYSEAEGCFVRRKPLSTLTKAEVDKIRDGKIKHLVKERLAKFDGDFKKTFGDINNPLLHADGKTPINSVRLKVNLNMNATHPIHNQDGNPYKYFKYGNNHHVEIIKNVNTGERKGVFITAMEATKRARVDKTAVVNRDHGPDWEFIMSLCINDMLEIDTKEIKQFYRVQALSGGKWFEITLKLLNDSLSDTNENTLRIRSKEGLKQIAKKVSVDYFGVITPCND